jgi:hypothetical protein
MFVLRSSLAAAMIVGCGGCAGAAYAQSIEKDPTGTRLGIFVKSDKTLSDLLGEGYELKDIHPGGDGTTFAVQREKSLFVCVAQDPFTRMDIPAQQRTYCLELSEKK